MARPMLGGKAGRFFAAHDGKATKTKEIIMKVLSATTAALVMDGTQAMASPTVTDVGGTGTAIVIFIAFLAVVILFQFLPGLTMFLRIFKGIFSTEVEHRAEEAAKDNRTSP